MCASLATKAASTLTVQQPPPPLKEQRANTFVVRCELDVAFGEESFKKAAKFTGSAIRGWAKAQGIAFAKIVDTVGNKLVGRARLQITLRVTDAVTVKQLCAKSGSECAGLRFFVDYVGNKETIGLPSKVQWMPWDGSETWTQYLHRIQRLGGDSGVALGSFQLGVRMSASDHRWTPPSCIWRLRGVPANWQYDHVHGLLQQLGYEEVDIQAKHPGRNRSIEWLFRAVRKDGKECLQQEVDWGDGNSGELTCIKEARRRQHASVEPLLPEKSVSFYGLFTAEPSKRESKHHTSSVAEQPVVASSPNRDTTGTCKRKTADDTEERMDVDKKSWFPTQGAVTKNPGEGNCLFLALVAATNARLSLPGVRL